MLTPESATTPPLEALCKECTDLKARIEEERSKVGDSDCMLPFDFLIHLLFHTRGNFGPRAVPNGPEKKVSLIV